MDIPPLVVCANCGFRSVSLKAVHVVWHARKYTMEGCVWCAVAGHSVKEIASFTTYSIPSNIDSRFLASCVRTGQTAGENDEKLVQPKSSVSSTFLSKWPRWPQIAHLIFCVCCFLRTFGCIHMFYHALKSIVKCMFGLKDLYWVAEKFLNAPPPFYRLFFVRATSL